MFLWLVCRDKLMTNEEGVRCHFSADARCPSCLHSPKSANHVLHTCPSACSVWILLIKSDKFDEFLRMDFQDWIEINLTNPSYFARVSIDWDLMFGAVAWNLWLDRNAMVFGNEPGVRQSVLTRSLWLTQVGQRADVQTRQSRRQGLAQPENNQI
ncbi:hypothetical protein V6N13_020267 [Hibiscus sabdariffa]